MLDLISDVALYHFCDVWDIGNGETINAFAELDLFLLVGSHQESLRKVSSLVAHESVVTNYLKEFVRQFFFVPFQLNTRKIDADDWQRMPAFVVVL